MNRPLHVCIVGPDGVGKTTIANHIIDSMESQGWKVVRLNARPKTVDAVTNQDFDYTNPHGLPPRNVTRSLAKAGLKFGYAWVQAVKARIAHCSRTVLIEERGWIDHGVDHRRYRIHPAAASVFRVAAPLTPGPDRTIVLTGDPETITLRKNELDQDEVARQLELWGTLCSNGRLGNATAIDTTETNVDDTINIAVDFLLEGAAA